MILIGHWAQARREVLMYADHPHDSDRETASRTTRRSEGEVVVERTPIVADSPTVESDLAPSTLANERRRSERRRIDRMSTGI